MWNTSDQKKQVYEIGLSNRTNMMLPGQETMKENG